jgi:hypothetical protein
MVIVLPEPQGFDWDVGNSGKNEESHDVSDAECEEVFFDPRKKLFNDTIHSGREERYILLGQTKGKRILFVVYTIRNKKIRVISARDLNKKERKLYE